MGEENEIPSVDTEIVKQVVILVAAALGMGIVLAAMVFFAR